MACDAYEPHLAAYLYDDIGAEDRARMEVHLAVCGRCRDVLASFAAVREELSRHAVAPGRPPAGVVVQPVGESEHGVQLLPPAGARLGIAGTYRREEIVHQEVELGHRIAELLCERVCLGPIPARRLPIPGKHMDTHQAAENLAPRAPVAPGHMFQRGREHVGRLSEGGVRQEEGDVNTERRLDEWRADDLRIGFTNGVFDLLHPGHVKVLAQARGKCDRLVVGLNSDASVRRLKGNGRPIQNERARAEVLAALEAVDLVVVFGQDTPLELIRRVRPNVLVKGGDYRKDQVVGRDLVEAQGGEVEIVVHDDEGTEQIVATLGEGDYFGEISFLRRTPRSATVRARTPTELHLLRRVDFDLLLNRLAQHGGTMTSIVLSSPVTHRVIHEADVPGSVPEIRSAAAS